MNAYDETCMCVGLQDGGKVRQAHRLLTRKARRAPVRLGDVLAGIARKNSPGTVLFVPRDDNPAICKNCGQMPAAHMPGGIIGLLLFCKKEFLQ